VRSADFVKDDKKSAKTAQVGIYEKFGVKVNTADNTTLEGEADYKKYRTVKAQKKHGHGLSRRLMRLILLSVPSAGVR